MERSGDKWEERWKWMTGVSDVGAGEVGKVEFVWMKVDKSGCFGGIVILCG